MTEPRDIDGADAEIPPPGVAPFDPSAVVPPVTPPPRAHPRWARWSLITAGAVVVLATGYFGVVAYQLQVRVGTLTEVSLDLGAQLAEERGVTASQDAAIERLAEEIADLRDENEALVGERDYARSVADLLSDCADRVDELVELVQVSKYYTLTPDLVRYRDSVTSVCTSAQKAHADLHED